MNKTIKIVSILLLAILLTVSFTTVVNAADDTTSTTGGTLSAGSIAADLTGTKSNAQDDVTKIGNKIIGLITTVGVVIAVVVLLILGIKYMIGSASEKAEYKKTMIPYLVGAILIFGASAITKVVISFGTSLS